MDWAKDYEESAERGGKAFDAIVKKYNLHYESTDMILIRSELAQLAIREFAAGAKAALNYKNGVANDT